MLSKDWHHFKGQPDVIGHAVSYEFKLSVGRYEDNLLAGIEVSQSNAL